MELSDFTGIAIAVSAIVGLGFALASQKKGGPKKVMKLHDLLLTIGLDAFILEEGGEQYNGLKGSWGEKPVGAITLSGKNIESINVIGVATQQGANYYLDYLVKSPLTLGMETSEKTKMSKRKSSPLWGKAVSIDWKGDNSLAQGLNFDSYLNDLLLQADPKGTIQIFPEPKSEYARIRTQYSLPSADMFEALEIIAGHVKSWS